MPSELNDWIARIRSRDAATFEDAYEEERPTGPEVVPRLLAEMWNSPDGYTRGKFLELLGEMGADSVIPHLIAELAHPAPDARRWAVLALEQLGSVAAVAAARRHREEHPEDFD